MLWVIKINWSNPSRRPSYFGPRTLPVADIEAAMFFGSRQDAEKAIEDLKHSGFAHLLEAVEYRDLQDLGEG